MLFRPISALILLPAIVLLFELGRRFHARRKIATTSAAVEGAVFGLFGLLLAFTFSGAMTRYDAHRTLLIEETNDIGTAYLRLDLLAPGSQPALRELFETTPPPGFISSTVLDPASRPIPFGCSA